MPVAEAQQGLAERRVSRSVQGAVIPEVIAELSGNHGGSIDNALRLIEEAKRAGADAVKFQCFEPEALAIKRLGIVWKGVRLTYQQLVSLYRTTYTPKAWFPAMVKLCDEMMIDWLASAFSPDDVAFLESMDCPRYKISAYEMLDGDLINAVVATGKPIIMSVRSSERVTILEATDYEGNFPRMGLSDHSSRGMPYFGARGRPMVERHLMLSDVPNEDSEFSSTPDQFAAYVSEAKS